MSVCGVLLVALGAALQQPAADLVVLNAKV